MIIEQPSPNEVRPVVLHSQLILPRREQPAPVVLTPEDYEPLWSQVTRIYDQRIQSHTKALADCG